MTLGIVFYVTLGAPTDGESTFRGRQDLTSAEYSLTSLVAVIGEDSLTEGALQERMIPVNISANGISQEMRNAFHLLRSHFKTASM